MPGRRRAASISFTGPEPLVPAPVASPLNLSSSTSSAVHSPPHPHPPSSSSHVHPSSTPLSSPPRAAALNLLGCALAALLAFFLAPAASPPLCSPCAGSAGPVLSLPAMAQPSSASTTSALSVAELNAASTPPLSLITNAFLAPGSGRRVQMVCVGDSITQRGQGPDGYLTLLSNWFARRVDVWNRGFSGYNSQWLHQLIEQQTKDAAHADIRRVWTYGGDDSEEDAASSPPPTPSAVYTLCIGANDAVLPPLSPISRQHVSVERFTEHVTAIVERLRGPRAAVILVTPPATDPHAWALSSAMREAPPGSPPGPLPPFMRSLANTARYAEAVKQVGAALQVPVVDLFTLTIPAQPSDSTAEPPPTNPFLIDGLHLSSRGNLVLFTALLQTISQHWPQLTTQQLPLDGPFHGDLNDDNYQQLLA